MRRACLAQVLELARRDSRVIFIGSDITRSGAVAAFASEMPDRFFMEGVSEGNIIGMAAGLALDGHIAYFNTIATFLTRRSYEQIAIDLCLHELKVRIIGSGGGTVYAPLGPTHLAIEDLALMRALPGMTVLAPADADEMCRLMPETLDWPGPIYIRLAKGGDPIVTQGIEGFTIGKSYELRPGKDGLFVTTGVTLQSALEASSQLERSGLSVGVLHMPTLKPFDRAGLLERAAGVGAIVSAEEHVPSGGLGSAVAESLAEGFGGQRAPAFLRASLPDRFHRRYQSQADLMATSGLDAAGLERQMKALLSAETVAIVDHNTVKERT